MQLPSIKIYLLYGLVLALILPSFTSQQFKASGDQHQPQGIYRAMIRAQSQDRIKIKNQQYGQYFTSSHNQFSTYTKEEWQQLFMGGRKTDPNSIEAKYVETATEQQKNKAGINAKVGLLNAVVPTVFNIDYSTSNPPIVTSVKNQGSCGSCWAFAAIAQMQTYFLKKHKLYLDLSEQQMVDCVPTVISSNQGCGGGSLGSVGYYSVLFPTAQEKHYLYTATESACSQDKINSGRTFKIGTYSMARNCVTMLNYLLTTKPLAVCAGVDDNWMHYKSGVLPVCNNDPEGGHCFLLVGATSDGTSNVLTNWYKFKNSWGTTWGEQGYIRIYRDPQDTKLGPCGFCGWGSMYTL